MLLLLTQGIKKPKLLSIVYVLCTSTECYNMARIQNLDRKSQYHNIWYCLIDYETHFNYTPALIKQAHPKYIQIFLP